MKKRLLIANDSHFISSGYGVYGKELLTRLHNSGKYDVAELGCYSDVNNANIKNTPWTFYPNGVVGNDERMSSYKESASNQFGAWRFNRCLLDFKPHIVFDVRDYWMYAYQEISPYRKYFHWILMPTVDSAPQKTDWLYTFCNADKIVPYTQWALKTLLNDCGNKINIFPKVANAGINPNEFYPIENKSAHKKSFLGKDYNVIGLVMRNQKRKLIPDILLAYKKYLEYLKQSGSDKYENTILYLHTSFPEENGWDLPSILLEFDLLDRVYFTYTCRHCNHVYASKFKGPIVKCCACGQTASSMAGVSNSISTENLNKIYNLFDIFVQYAICEGFGMPQVEAASAGIPIASVDYSAMTEIVEYLDGYKIPVIRMFRELETNADRAYPDIDATVQIFIDFFNLSEDAQKAKGDKTRQLCISRYTWDNVFKVWDECFDTIDVNNKKSWDDPEISTTNHVNNVVPRDLNPRQFVAYICDNILLESNLLDTAYCQALVKDITNIVGIRNGIFQNITHNEVTEKLEHYLINKMNAEKARIIADNLVKEDYIVCHNKKQL